MTNAIPLNEAERAAAAGGPLTEVERLRAEIAALKNRVAGLIQTLRDLHIGDDGFFDCDACDCGTNVAGAPLCPHCALLMGALAPAAVAEAAP